jgi:hypothetical protein
MLTEREVEDIMITLIINEKMGGGMKWMKTHKHPLLLKEIRPLDETEKQQILHQAAEYWKDCTFSFEEEVSPVSPRRFTLLVIG